MSSISKLQGYCGLFANYKRVVASVNYLLFGNIDNVLIIVRRLTYCMLFRQGASREMIEVTEKRS